MKIYICASTLWVYKEKHNIKNYNALTFYSQLVKKKILNKIFFVTDKYDPLNWKSLGVRAKAAFDFIATAPTELTVRTNDEIVIAPKYIQEEMKLTNSGWAYAVSNGKSGLVPLNYVVFVNNNVHSSSGKTVPIPRMPLKSNLKRVSFGENQIVSTDELDNLRKNEFAETAKRKEASSQRVNSGELDTIKKNGVDETIKQDDSSQSSQSDDLGKIQKSEFAETIKQEVVSDKSANSEESCSNSNSESSSS